MSNKDKSEVMEQALFKENEKNANHYTVRCLMFAAVVTVLIWILNLLDFFIVDDALMNLVMPISIVLLLIPLLLERFAHIPSSILRYILFLFFVLVIAMMSVAMPRHLVLAWACPVILACHYYSPKFARFALIATLIMMLASLYAGIVFGEWDRNILGNYIEEYDNLSGRLAYLRGEGRNVYLHAFEFYYLPRAGILCVVYLICSTLSKRTRGLLIKQGEAAREAERISTELNVAHHIQTSMLPSIFPAFPDHDEFDIFASMTPAKEVGGDFYDFFMVDERHLALVIADVSGKGVPAALFMVIGKTLIKDHTTPDRDLGAIFTKVNKLLCQSNSEGLFITAFEGVLDLDTGDFVYVNAGHDAPFICRKDGSYEPLAVKPGFVLAGMEETKFTEGKITLGEGDKLFHYTDGVTEATNTHNVLYGKERLLLVLNKNKQQNPKETLSSVKADIDDFVGETPQFDDITMLCVEYRRNGEK